MVCPLFNSPSNFPGTTQVLEDFLLEDLAEAAALQVRRTNPEHGERAADDVRAADRLRQPLRDAR